MRARMQTAMATLGALGALCGCGGAGHVTATSSSAGCPVSRPTGPRPPQRALLNLGDPIARASDPGWYGNGALWTVLPWGNQSLRGPGPFIHMKVPWFRADTGSVTITAAPVGGPPARFAASVGSPASYGATGFAPSILRFGRPGCWKLHAHLASRVLTLVVRVAPAT